MEPKEYCGFTPVTRWGIAKMILAYELPVLAALAAVLIFW